MIDWGLFWHVAEALAAEGKFGWVGYYAPWEGLFPASKDREVGEGFPGVERVKWAEDEIPNADLIVFPDCYMGPRAEFLRSIGKRVWAPGDAEFLEIDRLKAKAALATLELPEAEWTLVEGLDKLEKHLEKVPEAYIKTSWYRADFETFHHQKAWVTQNWIDKLRVTLGPRQKYAEFIVELPIEGSEIGMDDSTVDGQFSAKVMWGIENKSSGYLSQVVNYGDLPEPILIINEKIAPLLREYQTRSFFSCEIRWGKEKLPYVIDPCLRMGNPPSQLYMSVFNNWSEHLYYGAAGELVDLNPIAKYGAQIQLHSNWAKDQYLPVDIPNKILPFVKLQRPTMIGGKRYVVPGGAGVGAVIAFGDTLNQVVKDCLERAEELKSVELQYDKDALDVVLDSIEEARQYDINW